jgi:hypothetical protein
MVGGDNFYSKKWGENCSNEILKIFTLYIEQRIKIKAGSNIEG